MKNQKRFLKPLGGNRFDYYCPECENYGFSEIYDEVGDISAVRLCSSCFEVLECLREAVKNGFSIEMLKRCTFDNYKTIVGYQRKLKNTAVEFLSKDCKGKMFFVGGQSGCGKTHICTALSTELLLKHKRQVKYLQWVPVISALKTDPYNKNGIHDKFKEYIEADVLYIDDLFKSFKKHQLSPSDFEASKFYELLNSRYNSGECTTIISSEWMLNEILDFDTALGRRIEEKSKGFYVNVKPGLTRINQDDEL